MKKIIYGFKLFLTSELNIFNQLVLYIMSGDLSKYAGSSKYQIIFTEITEN